MADLIRELDKVSEEERLLYLSAKEVKRSFFWKHMLEELDRESLYSNQRMLTKLMEGDEKAAIIAAATIQAIGKLLSIMDNIVQDIEDALNQEQED